MAVTLSSSRFRRAQGVCRTSRRRWPGAVEPRGHSDHARGGKRCCSLTTPSRPGTRLLRATVLPLPEEAVASNNSATATVRVGREPAKLLYLEGIGRWDFRFLDHALRRDKGMTTTFVVESQLEADGVPADTMPEAAGLSTDGRNGPNITSFCWATFRRRCCPREQKALVEAVENDGLGLIVQCGTRHMPWDFVGGPLAGSCRWRSTRRRRNRPVGRRRRVTRIRPDAAWIASAGLRAVSHDRHAHRCHPSSLCDHRQRQSRPRLWSQMPEFYWAAAGTKLKPGAMRLADVEMAGGKDKLPILAEQVVGRGCVMVVGCDETFRWRRNVGDRIFYRFWGQALRHVAASRLPTGREAGSKCSPSGLNRARR